LLSIRSWIQLARARQNTLTLHSERRVKRDDEKRNWTDEENETARVNERERERERERRESLWLWLYGHTPRSQPTSSPPTDDPPDPTMGRST